MYISVFQCGSRSSRNYFSNVRTKAVASDSRKKQCTLPSIAASFVAAKRKVFRDVFLDLVDINFVFAKFRSILVIPAMFLTSAKCRLSDLWKPPSAAEMPPER